MTQKSSKIFARTFRKVLVATVGLVVATSEVAADVVRLHTAYLSEPTETCGRDDGIPVIMIVDGPNVHQDAFAAEYRPTVKVRRGLYDLSETDVGRVDATDVRTRRGGLAQTRERVSGPRQDEIEPLGRIRARINICETFWAQESVSGTWDVVAADGTVVLSGDVQRSYLNRGGHPLFSMYRYPETIRLNDEVFVVMEEPTFERTTEAFASPDKEQSQ